MDLFKLEDCDIETRDQNGITLEKANEIFKNWVEKQKFYLQTKVDDQTEKLFDLPNLYDLYGDLVDL